MRTGSPAVGGVAVICEVASAHGGDADRMIALLDAADAADADWVKLQIFSTERLVAKENGSFPVFKSLELDKAQWERVFSHAAGLRPRLIAEVFDMESLELVAKETVVAGYKIPTADLGDAEFVAAVCRQGKPVFIAVGGASVAEIDAIFDQVSRHPEVELVLLHGFQNFPTRLEDSLLSRIPWLKARYGCQVGFADHVDAEDAEMARTLPAMAIAAGATVIEKHITLDRAAQGFDYYSALNPGEFASFVGHMRRVCTAVGSPDEGRLTPAETEYRNKMKKFAVVGKPIIRGTRLGDAVIEYQRTSIPGLTRKEVESRANVRVVSDVEAGCVIEEGHLEQN
jgi:N,N'-diacetyllegionaminate synthase